jgi:CobQ-like glutamine amidotransferase family enzyme
MEKRILRILNLYPSELNIYGDTGNLFALAKRIKGHGLGAEIVRHNVGDRLDANIDIVLGGGGQDSGQARVALDLLKNSDKLLRLAEDSVPMLLVCGSYQLFGRRFVDSSGKTMDGIGIFSAVTKNGDGRLIGNTVYDSDILPPGFGEIVGFENHGGRTYLDSGQQPFAKVVKGAGNNGEDGTEGARSNNAIGTYAHGPVLPKNPKLLDGLIRLAAMRKYGDFAPAKFDDSIADMAHAVAKSRP